MVSTLYIQALLNNSNTYLDLVSGDVLKASFGDESKTMERNNLGSMVWYVSNFLGDAEGSEFNISFERDSDDNAPDSKVTLPARFDITVPSEGDTFSILADKIDIAWDNSGTDDEMHIMLSGDCFSFIGCWIKFSIVRLRSIFNFIFH